MINRELNIINKLGLHARAAAKFVATASEFKSNIQLANQRTQANGKSIMSIMMLAAGQGTTLTLIADGEDEAAAVSALEQLVQNRFGEGE
ncbi:MAG: HPr family phosphocarrier protein [Sedimenticola sp.]|jgi:phosphocarrier protein|nr:MAG: HPr family phosphocarrier protein [Sedimenticola sp.]